jgi:shikimate kinase
VAVSPEASVTAPPLPAVETVRRLLGSRAIVLVGMMGAGKSSLGKRLAAWLDLPFVDADAEIEAAANASISDIFERYGEAYFRDGERRVIQRLLNGDPKVIATGGGAYMNLETRAAINAGGVAIWLKADLDVLMSRVKRRSNRPLLKGGDPAETMRQLMNERYPVYAQAPIHIASREVAHETVLAEILAALVDYLSRTDAPRTP